MRSLRLSLVGAVILTLLGGVVGVASAADEPSDPMAPALVSGTQTWVGANSPGIVRSDAVERRTEGVSHTYTWEANDPRLAGTSTDTANAYLYLPADVQVEATTRVLVNDGGRWVGTATVLSSSASTVDTVIMYGEDAYEGLTAYVLIEKLGDRWSSHPVHFTAAVFPGEMPAFPDLPAE